MSRAIVLAFAVFTLAAASDCRSGDCQDETSLVQVKAALKSQKEIHIYTNDPNDPLVQKMNRARDNGWKDPESDFDNGKARRTNATGGMSSAELAMSECLDDVDFEGQGGYPACASKDAPTDQPCDACIKDQWAQHSAAGYACCKAASKAQLMRAPLCGLCLRADKGALGGTAADKADQANFVGCAAKYCLARDKKGSALTPAILAQIATECSPEKTKNPTTPERHMMAIVANNPKKGDLEEFLISRKGQISAALQSTGSHVTGTASSSAMAFCVTKSTKAGFSTFSGPWGGDAQLAGLLAAQCASNFQGEPYIDRVIFLADKDEAHHDDILSLMNIIEKCLSTNKYAFNKAAAIAVVNGLEAEAGF